MVKLAAIVGDRHSHCGAAFGDPNQYCVTINGKNVLVSGATTVDGHAASGSSVVTIEGKFICVTADPIQPHPEIGGGVIVTGTQDFYYTD